MGTLWLQKGQQRARAAILARDDGALWDAVVLGVENIKDTDGHYLLGVVNGLCQFLSTAELVGCTFTDANDEKVDIDKLWMQLAGAINSDRARFPDLIQVAMAAFRVLLKTPFLTISVPTLKPVAPPSPLKVEVVSMPAREKTTSINYDDDSNIVSTTQIECDRA